MKKKADVAGDDLRPHYDLDYAKSRPNRFAERPKIHKGGVVRIDDDVAAVFRTDESVNDALRSLIRSRRTPPKPVKTAATKKRRAS
jgi:hypothetical protein